MGNEKLRLFNFSEELLDKGDVTYVEFDQVGHNRNFGQ
jgi:hypothetical protein